MLILIFKIETKILWIASWDQDWINPSLLQCALAYCN